MIKVNFKETEWRDGLTVQNILDEHGYTFNMLAVWINDTPVTREAFSTTLVPDGADVQAIHLISGG
jgi:sulfur carrier protein